jgi:hypothetical protein
MKGTRAADVSGLCAGILMGIFLAGGAAASDRCLSELDRGPDLNQQPDKDSIKIFSMTPEAGSEVHKWTVLVADLAYTLKDFAPDKYFVTAQFALLGSNMMTDGNFKHSDYHDLSSATGTYRLCFHLTDIWNQQGLRKPLEVRFLLNRRDDPHSSHSVAVTDKIQLLVK